MGFEANKCCFRISPKPKVEGWESPPLSSGCRQSFDPAMNAAPFDLWRRFLLPITLLSMTATGLSVCRADIVYVSFGDRTGNSRPNLIKKFDSVTHADLGIFANTGLSLPQGLALDVAGNLYVANYGNNTIQKFTPDGVGSLFANTGSGPQSLAFDQAGNLYVANYWGNTIEKFTPQGVGSVFASTGLSYPTGLTIDSAGNLYVANGGTLNIRKFTPQGVGSLFANTGPFSSPLAGLACDSANNIYLGQMGLSSTVIQKFTPAGVGSVFADNGSGTGLTFDSAGNLFAANYGDNTIAEFAPNGTRTYIAGFPYSPNGIAIQPVPEPSLPAFTALVVFAANWRARKTW
jgi:sugar lactone lactonase YvrE